jgi:hypothetical protein
MQSSVLGTACHPFPVSRLLASPLSPLLRGELLELDRFQLADVLPQMERGRTDGGIRILLEPLHIIHMAFEQDPRAVTGANTP